MDPSQSINIHWPTIMSTKIDLLAMTGQEEKSPTVTLARLVDDGSSHRRLLKSVMIHGHRRIIDTLIGDVGTSARLGDMDLPKLVQQEGEMHHDTIMEIVMKGAEEFCADIGNANIVSDIIADSCFDKTRDICNNNPVLFVAEHIAHKIGLLVVPE